MQELSSASKDVKDNLGAGFATSSEDSVPGCSRGEKFGPGSYVQPCTVPFFFSFRVGILGKVFLPKGCPQINLSRHPGCPKVPLQQYR